MWFEISFKKQLLSKKTEYFETLLVSKNAECLLIMWQCLTCVNIENKSTHNSYNTKCSVLKKKNLAMESAFKVQTQIIDLGQELKSRKTNLGLL